MVAVGTNTLNVVVTLLLVVGLDRGIGGAAAGTVVAKVVAALCYLVMVLRLARRRKRTPSGPRAIRSLSVVGRDIFVRTVALRASLTITVSLAARKGVAALAAYQVAFQVWSALAYVLDALEAAAQSLVANALEARDRPSPGAPPGASSRGRSEPVPPRSAPRPRLTAGGAFSEDADVLDLLVVSLLWVAALQPSTASRSRSTVSWSGRRPALPGPGHARLPGRGRDRGLRGGRHLRRTLVALGPPRCVHGIASSCSGCATAPTAGSTPTDRSAQLRLAGASEVVGHLR
ncbi:MAG: hypothetical protein R2716_07770 [Microthrixaceae bacterium]